MNGHAQRRLIIDALLAVAASAFAVGALAFDFEPKADDATALSWLAVGICGVVLIARRYQPETILAVVLVGRLVVKLDAGTEIALAPAVALALYTVARGGRRGFPLAIIGTGLVISAVAIASLDDDPFIGELLGETTLMLLPVAVGEAVRSRAERLEQRIEAEAEVRVHRERVRIARDLHDIVAHGLSTIAVQSGIASHLLAKGDSDSSSAREALDIINQTGKRTLEELRTMVGMLRATDEDASLQPAPTDPNSITELLEGASQAGLDVTVRSSGSFPPDVADACVVALHRIVQEALMNVARHAGPVPVTVAIDHSPDEVRCVISNPASTARPQTTPSTGVGVLGMTERAESLGGSLRAHPTRDGGFEVVATIPYSRGA